jgi:hypothetical protein
MIEITVKDPRSEKEARYTVPSSTLAGGIAMSASIVFGYGPTKDAQVQRPDGLVLHNDKSLSEQGVTTPETLELMFIGREV